MTTCSPTAKILTASINGKGGSDTLDFSAYTTAVNVLLTGLGGTDGFNGATSGATNPITGTFSNINVIHGTASGSLTGINTAATWDLGAGTYTSTNVLSFTGFSTLVAGTGAGDTFDIDANVAYTLDGGTGADKFVFSNGDVLTGSIDGKGGNDTLDFTAYTTAVNVNLSAIGATDGFNGSTSGATNPIPSGSFSNINTVKGTTSGTLTGITTAATWDLGAGTYTVGTNVLNFTGFSTLAAGNSAGDTFDIDANVSYTLDGGTGADDFVFSNGDVLTGSIDGGAGSDTLDLSAYSTALIWTITGANAGTVGPVTGGFTTMETLDGGAGGNTFNINSSTIMSLNGGEGADDYVFANGKILTGSIDGKGGSDTLDFSAYATAVNVTLTARGADGFNGTTSGGTNPITGSFSNINATSPAPPAAV